MTKRILSFAYWSAPAAEPQAPPNRLERFLVVAVDDVAYTLQLNSGPASVQPCMVLAVRQAPAAAARALFPGLREETASGLFERFPCLGAFFADILPGERVFATVPAGMVLVVEERYAAPLVSRCHQHEDGQESRLHRLRTFDAGAKVGADLYDRGELLKPGEERSEHFVRITLAEARIPYEIRIGNANGRATRVTGPIPGRATVPPAPAREPVA